MKTVSTTYQCKCGTSPVTLSFRKPSPYYGSTIMHICPNCETETIVKVVKVKRDYKIFVKNTFISPKLSAILSKSI